ncbi:hypothetical protein AAC387_Pa04g1579 [Persea americana]
MEEKRTTWRWKVQRQIVQALKIDLQGDSDPFRALKNQRFLIILEDVWERVYLDKIGVPNPSNGSKIIITSRSGQGFKHMVRLEEGKGEDEEELRKEEVSDAAKLTIVCGGKLGSGSFASLKHIHLHLCPKLVYCFSSIICLGQLESLEIKFYARLKKVLEEDNEEDQIVFPSLKRICLWKLPKLQSICYGNLPNLEELKVGGCSKLKKLPLQVNRNSSAAPLKIRGEEKWWNNTNGDGGIKQQPHISFKPAWPTSEMSNRSHLIFFSDQFCNRNLRAAPAFALLHPILSGVGSIDQIRTSDLSSIVNSSPDPVFSDLSATV